MQHHGVPTRLLDWTSVLGIAVFFATGRYSSAQDAKDFAIYVLNPNRLNKTAGRNDVYSSEDNEFKYQSIYWHHRPFDPPGAIALETPFVNDRIYAQQGLFTVHINNEPLESKRPDALRKIVLRACCACDAREFLTHSNLNDATVFPDMEGLVRYVKTQMGALSASASPPRTELIGYAAEAAHRNRTRQEPTPSYEARCTSQVRLRLSRAICFVQSGASRDYLRRTARTRWILR